MRAPFFALLSASAAVAIDAADLRRAANSLEPNGYIVELASSPSKRFEDIHAEFISDFGKRATGGFAARKKFASPIFNGIAVELRTATDLAELSAIPNVVAVRPNVLHPHPEKLNFHVVNNPKDSAIVADGLAPHVMTGVDKAHAQGYMGKGVKIGIIDSGVDYTHPNLGGGFGPGFKIAGGYDLVGDAYDGTTPPVPDSDPLDTCDGHGTHVAGIIGADPGNAYNITGVAYEAELYAYRIFGCAGGATDDIVIAGLLRAHDEGMDVLTLSLGSASGWSSTSSAVVASRIADQGRVVTIAAGNDGDAGGILISSPSTGPDVISVGSVENIAPVEPTITTNVADHPTIAYVYASWPNPSGQPLPIDETPLPVYALTSDPLAEDTACEPLGDDVPDLSSYAVVLRNASACGELDQFDNLRLKNPKVVILYNSNEYLLFGFFQAANLLNDSDGIWLVNEFNRNPNLTVTFNQHGGTQYPNTQTGGLVSYFSSFGPTNELLFKPAISAPGGNITSTWLTNDGSFAVESGTSMSTPFIAGSAALVLQAKGKAVAKNIRTLLQSTSTGVPATKGVNPLPQTLAQQGAGLVNVWNALSTQTEVSPAELLLNDTAHWKSTHKITIKNTSKYAKSYHLMHQAAATTVTIPSGDNNIHVYPVPLVDAPATIKLSHTQVTVQPGRSAAVTVTILPPPKADPKTWPIVSGWIHIRDIEGTGVKVSYMGIGASMYDAQTISTGNNFLVPGGVPALFPLEGGPIHKQDGPRNYTIDNLPFLAYIQGQGSPRVVLDLIKADANLSSTIPVSTSAKRDLFWTPHKPGGSYSKVPIVGIAYEGDYIARNGWSNSAVEYYTLDFPATFANGTAVPLGQYRLLLRSLRLTGNPAKEEDYDVYVSEQVGIVESL